MEIKILETSSRDSKVAYANLASRIFLKSLFDNQWVIPDPPPRYLERFFYWYENHVLQVDLAGISIDRPIFLISLPRCGSSMLQDIICRHPDIAYTTNMMHTFRTCFCAAEYFRRKFRFNIRGERFLKDSVSVDGGTPADPVATWAEWLKQDPWTVDCPVLRREDFSVQEIATIYEGIRKVLWCFKGATRFECKNPGLLPHAALLQELFPDARFVHLVRDARASANSLLKLQRLANEQLQTIRQRQGREVPDEPFIAYPRLPRLKEYLDAYGPDDIRTTAHLWNEGVEIIERNRARFKHFYEVRYEDILADPQNEIGRILEFCELSRPAPENTRFWDQVKGVGVVHHKNRYADFELIEEICRDNMQRLGYLSPGSAE